jgi:FKBP-type peptidyl-prolyl cis-trans isomerase (trigger factor)
MTKHFKNLQVSKGADAEASITGELTFEFLNECRAEALKALNERTKLDGFRSGHIPADVLEKKLGNMRILEEIAEVALGKEYPEIIKEAKLSPIGRPTVAITKLAPGIPLEFKITLSLEPEFELPDYKKIAKDASKEKTDTAVTDKEIDDVLEEIKKQNWKPDLKEGENLRDKAKENILAEKEFRIKEKRRLTIIDGLIKATEIKIPKVLVLAELERMMAQFKDDVTRQGIKWDEYLKSIKKNEEDIKAEWNTKASDRVKAELLVTKIAEEEKLEPNVEELEKETKHLLEHYPDADPLRVRIYIYGQMRNEKVFDFLENLK